MGFSKKRVENCLGMEGWLMWEKLNEGGVLNVVKNCMKFSKKQ